MGMPTAESASAIRGSDPACGACYWVSGHIWDKLMLHFGLIVTTVVPQSKLSDRRSNSEKSPRRWRLRQTLRLRGWKRDQIMANILSRFPEELPPYLHWIDSACNANRSGQISISVICWAFKMRKWNAVKQDHGRNLWDGTDPKNLPIFYDHAKKLIYIWSSSLQTLPW